MRSYKGWRGPIARWLHEGDSPFLGWITQSNGTAFYSAIKVGPLLFHVISVPDSFWGGARKFSADVIVFPRKPRPRA